MEISCSSLDSTVFKVSDFLKDMYVNCFLYYFYKDGFRDSNFTVSKSKKPGQRCHSLSQRIGSQVISLHA